MLGSTKGGAVMEAKKKAEEEVVAQGSSWCVCVCLCI